MIWQISREGVPCKARKDAMRKVDGRTACEEGLRLKRMQERITLWAACKDRLSIGQYEQWVIICFGHNKDGGWQG